VHQKAAGENPVKAHKMGIKSLIFRFVLFRISRESGTLERAGQVPIKRGPLWTGFGLVYNG